MGESEMKREHKQELLASIDPEKRIRSVQPSWDNKNYVYICFDKEKNYFFGINNEPLKPILGKWPNGQLVEPLFSFSPDGKKSAVAKIVNFGQEKWHSEIYVNNELIWKSDDYFMFTILKWISNERLAWRGSYPQEKWKRRHFINGIDVTEISQTYRRNHAYSKPFKMLEVHENDSCFTICEDGELLNVEEEFFIFHPVEEKDPITKLIRVCYNEIKGEWIEGVEGEYIFTKDGKKTGYSAYSSLFSLITDLRHYRPVDNGRVWKKRYKHIPEIFFTPSGELVAFAIDDANYRMIVIDEDEGPKFDEIYNARYLETENCLTYLAKQGNEILRITVSC